jgi:glycyl-tRNA synthetase
MPDIKKIISYSREYGFIFPSNDIYEGLQAVYDYGQNGVELKNNIKNLWWSTMVNLNEEIIGIDSSILSKTEVWKASGHLEGFNDLLVDNKDSKKRYRVDILIEEFAYDLYQKKNIKKSKEILSRLNDSLAKEDKEDLLSILNENKIKCQISNSCNWSDVKNFNLMFKTDFGFEDSQSCVYLRPECAQGVFINFSNVQKTSRKKIPFGIAQIGKAFRNEIIARQFIFRMKEFEQMELQYFIKPGTEDIFFEKWKNYRYKWYKTLGIEEKFLSIKKHSKLAHYAKDAVDIEFLFEFGSKEIEGIHSRTDFDLKNHKNLSKKNLEYFDSEENKSYIPYVIETSCGVDRIFFMILSYFLKTIEIENETRTVFQVPYFLSPIKCAILPLMKKEQLINFSKKVYDNLKFSFNLDYDQTQSIGKRYARQDAIGTPFCITVDYETLENDSVTIRDRDSRNQIRINIQDIERYILDRTSSSIFLKKINSIDF